MTMLDEHEWNDFIKRVKAEENIKVTPVPTPKLAKAAELVRSWLIRNDMDYEHA